MCYGTTGGSQVKTGKRAEYMVQALGRRWVRWEPEAALQTNSLSRKIGSKAISQSVGNTNV